MRSRGRARPSPSRASSAVAASPSPAGRRRRAAVRPSGRRRRGRPTTPTPTATPTRCPRRRARPPARAHFCVHWVAEGIDAPEPHRRATATASPTTSSGCWRSPNTSTRSRTASSAGASPRPTAARAAATARPTSTSPRSAAHCSATRRPTAARRRKAAPAAAPPARLPRPRQRLRAFEFPGTKPLHDLEVTFAHEYNHILQFGYDAYQDAWFAESTAVWMEDQVYNGINDYLRYVRRWVQALRHAADRELDQGVRLRGLEQVAGAPLRPRDHPQGLGAARSTPGPAASRSPPTNAAIRAAGGSDFSRDFARFARDVRRVAHRHGLPREATLYPDVPRQGSLPLRRPRARRAASTTRPSSCCACTPSAGAAVVVHAAAPRRRRGRAWPWSAGSAASATAASSQRLTLQARRRAA